MSNCQTEKIKVLFMGTPEFAVPGLLSLINSVNFEVLASYTQPDKKIGRKQLISIPPVKRLSIENRIPVFQPTKLKEETNRIKEIGPDLIVVIAYGKIIPQEILDIPKFGCINVHASLLPKYRGSACLNAPIVNGDKETGITIMKMDAGLDTGPIIWQEILTLKDNETLPWLHDKLSELGASVLPQVLEKYVNNDLKAEKQDDNKATYISLLKKEDGKLDFFKPAKEVERMIRGLNPWPGTFAIIDNVELKIIEAKAENLIIDDKAEFGQLFSQNNRLLVKCGQNYLDILKLQLPGKKVLEAKDFINGNRHLIGKVLK